MYKRGGRAHPGTDERFMLSRMVGSMAVLRKMFGRPYPQQTRDRQMNKDSQDGRTFNMWLPSHHD